MTRWVCTALPDLSPPLAIHRVGNGRSNLTFAVEDAGGRRIVLRRPPLGPLAPSAHDMAREHRILTVLAEEDVPAPRPLAMCADETVTGAPFYVMEHVDGVVLHAREAALGLPATARAHAGISLGTTLATIHRIGPDKVPGLGRGSGYAQRQIRRWNGMWDQTRTRELPSIEAVGQALAHNVPPQEETTLVHGDYSLANVILSANGDVMAVLDWELCTLGDPLADVGMLVCYWPDRASEALPERDPISLLPGFPSRDEILSTYRKASGGRPTATLTFWVALSYWKLAIILEGVHRRALDNPLNASAGAERVRESVDLMAALAAAEVGSW